jgi:hypothetical protein
MAKKETQPAAEAQPAETAQQPQGPSLSLQDLILVAQIIQLTTQRGAFKAEELQNVGALYNKLVSFLEASGAVSRTAPEGQQENENA